MMKVCYSELDGPEGLSCRLEAAGHAGFAPAGQDIVCAGASTLMQTLVYLLAGENTGSKYQKALTLGTPIITEAEFLDMIRE